MEVKEVLKTILGIYAVFTLVTLFVFGFTSMVIEFGKGSIVWGLAGLVYTIIPTVVITAFLYSGYGD